MRLVHHDEAFRLNTSSQRVGLPMESVGSKLPIDPIQVSEPNPDLLSPLSGRTFHFNDGERAALAIKGAEGKRLTYRQPY